MEFRFLWLTSVGINKKEVDKQWKPVFMIKSIAFDLNVTWWHHKYQLPDFLHIGFWIYPSFYFHKSSFKANFSTTKPSCYKGKFLFIFLGKFLNVLWLKILIDLNTKHKRKAIFLLLTFVFLSLLKKIYLDLAYWLVEFVYSIK